MKTVLLITMLVIFNGCAQNGVKDDVERSIPGVYTRFSKHEFGTEHDTLVITLQNSTTHEYSIERKWRYDRVLDEKTLDPDYKQESGTGIYDPRHKYIKEIQSGNIFSFDVKEKLLFNGPAKYQKI